MRNPACFDLVVETSRKGIALGLYSSPAGAECWERFAPAARGELLDGMLLELLAAAGAELAQVHRVLVTLGPGTFTGLRTGIAFCEGLCVTGNRSLHGVSTLRAMASRLPGGALALDWPNGGAVVYKARPGYWYVGMGSGEYFTDTENAAKLLMDAHAVVADDAAIAEPGFGELDRTGWLADNGEHISSFKELLRFIVPHTALKANYIQDSYFEKKA